jgi:6-phosphogluconolactonase (cycloisomerase 2 family)
MNDLTRHGASRPHSIRGFIGVFVAAAALVSIVAAADRVNARQAAEDERRLDARRHDDDRRPGTVWVLNRDRGELTIFAATSGKVLRQLPVGAGAHDICISEQAGKAYITAETVNQVTVGGHENTGRGFDRCRSVTAPRRAEP